MPIFGEVLAAGQNTYTTKVTFQTRIQFAQLNPSSNDFFSDCLRSSSNQMDTFRKGHLEWQDGPLSGKYG